MVEYSILAFALNQMSFDNEAMLQFELGYYLRDEGFKIHLERNVEKLGLNKKEFIKKEIDILIEIENKYIAIELKYPQNGQIPESMFSFLKDIKFLEELKSNSLFTECYLLIFVEDEGFYKGNRDNIYSYFRSEIVDIPNIAYTKPTGKKDEIIELKHSYKAKWQDKKVGKFLLIKV